MDGLVLVISRATNVPVVVEASADVGKDGSPISTNMPTDGGVQFADPERRSDLARVDRVRAR